MRTRQADQKNCYHRENKFNYETQKRGDKDCKGRGEGGDYYETQFRAFFVIKLRKQIKFIFKYFQIKNYYTQQFQTNQTWLINKLGFI